MKPLLLIFIGIMVFTGVGTLHAQYADEVMAPYQKELLFEKGEAFLDQLPQGNGLSAKKPKGNVDAGLVVMRSFLVYKKQLSVLSHVVADVSYTARLTFSEGKYSYDFGKFKVYTYRRDRYGKYSRSNSKGQEVGALSGEIRVLVQEAIVQHMEQYIGLLKNAMQ